MTRDIRSGGGFFQTPLLLHLTAPGRVHKEAPCVGPVAQLVEQLTFNQWVTGSNPVGLTTESPKSLERLPFRGGVSLIPLEFWQAI